MDEQEFRSTYKIEGTHWSQVSLRESVRRSVGAHLRKLGSSGWGTPALVLDAGCGTGAMLNDLGKGCRAVGLDYSGMALSLTRQRGCRELVRGTVTSLPFADSTFDVVLSLDVLYQPSVEDDVEALREMRRVLKPGGALILSLPAYGIHGGGGGDRRRNTKRRYTRRLVRKRLAAAGLAVERITYRGAAALPATAAYGLVKRRLDRPGARPVAAGREPSGAHPFVNRVMQEVMRAESRVLKSVDLPFGTSVYCVAKKY